MSLILSGTDGLSDVDGTAATPAIRGTDANTGIFFGADIIGFSEGGAEVARFNADAQFVTAAGTASLPVITTTGDVNTGIFFPAADTIAFSEGGAEAMRIDSSGNVGIGTNSPSTQLQMNSGAATYSDQLRIRNTNFGNADIGVGSGIMAVATDMSNIAFYTSSNLGTTGSALPNNERMRIDSDGNLQLGYGGISPTTVAAPQGMSLVSNSNVALQIYMLKNAQVESHIGFKSSTDTNFYVGTSGGQGAAGIGVYGVYQVNTSTSWTAVSDERFKTELQPIENALEKVAGVRAVTGQYIYDEENGVTKRRPFLIAQDFLTALPEAVDMQDPEKYGLSYSDTVPLLFAAIKEQQALITALTARIAALETQNADNPPQGETP
jgi:hypothetical protein